MTDFELVSVAVSCGNGFCTRNCPFYSDDGSGCQRKLIDMLAKKLDIVLHQRDERKIKHGHWETMGLCLKCSECGLTVYIGTYDKRTLKHHANAKHYCEKCGARMDGEDNDT